MPISAEEYAAIALAGYGGDIKDMSTDDSLAKEAHDRDYARVKKSLVDVKDTNTHEYPRLEFTSESSDAVGILEEWFPEAYNSSPSRNTNAGRNGRHGHDELDETLSSDDDGSTHYKTAGEKQDAGWSRDEVDASNVEGDEADDDSNCWEKDSREQEPVWSDDEVDESNGKYEKEVDAVSEENEEDDHVDDDDDDSHSSEDVPRNPRYRRKQVSPTLDEDDESNAQHEGDEDHEEAGDDDDDNHISNHLEKDATRKLELPRKPGPIRGKRKRGRPRKQEPPTLDGDSGDDDYKGGRPRKMLKETKRKRGRPRKMVKETKSKGTKSDGRRTTIMSEVTTRAPVAVLKAKTNEEPRREPGTEIGSSVYAKWLDGSYYWAVIVDIKRKRCSHFDQHSLQFYDGDFLEYVSRKDFDTEEEVLTLCDDKPPPMPNKIRQMVKTNSKPASLHSCNPRELYNRRCNHCIHCRKPDCGECSICTSGTKNVKGKRQVCLQKMCIKIPVRRKEQPAVGLPAGWTFIFEEESKSNPKKTYIPGLFIFHPNTKKPFRSVEAAITKNPKILEANPHAVHDFYKHVGINLKQVSGSLESQKPSVRTNVPRAVSSSMSLEELLTNKCGKCVNCSKDDCRRCTSCVSKSGSQVCIQKMCCEVSLMEKAQPMPPGANFPVGWKFVIDSTMEGYQSCWAPMKGAEGLKILSPTGAYCFYSVEQAKAHHFVKQKDVCEQSFYAHIGALATDGSRVASGSSASRSDVNHEDMQPQEICGECQNCTKDPCGRCSRCRSHHLGRSRDCFQKMCFRISLRAKAEGAKGLPRGWRFYFAEDRPYVGRYKSIPCLYILSPGGKRFRSVEAAFRSCKLGHCEKISREFYPHVGLGGVPEQNALKARQNLEDMRPQEICGECENCMKDPCGRCSRCRSHHLGRSRDCFQKMCFRISLRAKAEGAKGLPRGWHFYFAEDRPYVGRYKSIPCLYILSPGGKRFRSVEAAVRSCKLGHCEKISREFYLHVGLGGVPEQNALKPRQNLSNYRVIGSRVYCQWGNMEGSWGNIEAKFEIRPNRFIYSVRLENDNSLIENLDENCIQSEVLYKSKTGKEPPLPLGRHQIKKDGEEESIEDDPDEEQKTEELCIGEIKTTTDHFLVGRKFYLAWTDLTGQNRMVYGEVTECEMHMQSGKVIRFRVMYSSKSKRELDEIGNGCGLGLPESQMLPSALVVGGCVLFEKERGVACAGRLLTSNYLLPFYWSWITPMRRHEELVDSGSDTRLPRLTLLWQGFRLALNVKPSTIPNAGYGVFLSCTSLMQDAEAEYFELKPGELIDLGIYGPLQIQDQKLEAVFFVKNFVHSHKCDVFTFDAGDNRYQLDITDDVSGELHAVAKSHVLAYVNESDVERLITIKAEHDPEGSVHYLLGHANQSQGSFVVPADGSEVEVFVNYGSNYENVRIRKGYSFVSREERARVMDILSHEDAGDLKEMERFEEAEIEACVKFLWTLFSTEEESQFTSEVIERALTCAVVLQRRAEHKFSKQVQRAQNVNGGTMEASAVDLKKVLKESRLVVSLLLGMMREEQHSLRMLQNAGKFDELRRKLFQRRFSSEELLDFNL